MHQTMFVSRRGCPCLIGLIVLLVTNAAVAQVSAVRVDYSVGSTSVTFQTTAGTTSFSNPPYFSGTVSDEENGDYLLTIENISGCTINDVWFPINTSNQVMGTTNDDDVILIPYNLGAAFKSTEAGTNEPRDWWLPHAAFYGDGFFAPFAIISDSPTVAAPQQAVIAMARDWPPKKVSPAALEGKIALVYVQQNLTSGGQSYLHRIVNVSDGSIAYPAWMRAADHYKLWLRDKRRTLGYLPFDRQSWLSGVQGIFDIQLQDISVLSNWTLRKTAWEWLSEPPYSVTWVQFWGQMSNYVPGSLDGCCALNRTLNERYSSIQGVLGQDIREFAQSVTSQPSPKYVGYYTRPYEDTLLDANVENTDPVETNRQWWYSWIASAGGPDDVVEADEWGANAYYLDTFAADYYAPVSEISALLRNQVGPIGNAHFERSITEGAVDLYSTASYVSGCVNQETAGFEGGLDDNGDPAYWERLSNGEVPFVRVMVPELGTYVIEDHIFFSGEGNVGAHESGPSRDYWVERQAFLLGHRFDIQNPYDNMWAPPFPKNLAYDLGLTSRNAIQWASRKMIYRHRFGISAPPRGAVDVRRFYDCSERREFLVIDNWDLVGGNIQIENLSCVIPIGNQRLQIIALTPCAAFDLNASGSVDLTDLSTLLANFGSLAGLKDGDFDCNLAVDLADLSVLLSKFGETCNDCD